MKAVPDSQARETSSFTNIRQGAVEAYIDFIDRLQEAIERQIDNDRACLLYTSPSPRDKF